MKSQNMARAFELYTEFQIALRMSQTDAVESKDRFAAILISQLLEETCHTHWLLQRMQEAAQI